RRARPRGGVDGGEGIYGFSKRSREIKWTRGHKDRDCVPKYFGTEPCAGLYRVAGPRANERPRAEWLGGRSEVFCAPHHQRKIRVRPCAATLLWLWTFQMP